jgi:CheY-like chemotaxis protein
MERVLIVEDDEDLRELFAEVLSEAGYGVNHAENGKVALDVLEQSDDLCLVLLDLMMPIMSGPELARRMKQSPRLAAMPIVALSAGGQPSDVPQADVFLRKPLEPEKLLEVVARYCGGACRPSHLLSP